MATIESLNFRKVLYIKRKRAINSRDENRKKVSSGNGIFEENLRKDRRRIPLTKNKQNNRHL